MKRIVSIHLCQWSLDRLYRCSAGLDPDVSCLVLFTREAGAHHITAASSAARNAGIVSGDRLADARAVCPSLVSCEADPAADARALEKLAIWMIRWTPSVAIDGRDGLFLDITGCSHLFGGETSMLADMSGRLSGAGVTHRLAVADTPGAAWALARWTARTEPVICARSAHDRVLGPLPVEALRLSVETTGILARFGLARISDLSKIPRRALNRRVGDSVVMRLDQAFGRRAEPLTCVRPPVVERVVLPCPEPLRHPDGVRCGLEVVLRRLCSRLRSEGRGVRALSFSVFRADGEVCTISVRMSCAVDDPEHCGRLFAEHLDRIDAGEGIDCLVLEATRSQKRQTSTEVLSPQWSKKIDIAASGRLVDTLSQRTRVFMATPHASHVPEHSESCKAFDQLRPGRCWPDDAMPPRPLRLLSPPEPVDALAELPDSAPVRFIWRRISYRIVRADGPERIAGQWWSTDASTRGERRDYYRLEDSEGQRFWLFRLWDESSAPCWYVHGLFA